MGKSHRDNHKARKKIGAVAFAKKAKRRAKRKRIAERGMPTFTEKEND